MAKSKSRKLAFDEDSEIRFLKYFRIITNDNEYPYQPPSKKFNAKTDPEKNLVLSDIHEPYADITVMRECLNHRDAETIIIPGDIGDFYSKSRFKKTRHVSFKEEGLSVFRRLEWCSTNFKNVKVMLGNHDNRPEKMITGRMQDGEVDLLILTEQNLLKRFASYFDNIEVVGLQISSEIEMTHIYQHGDCIFTHGELSAAQESMVLERISNYLSKWKDRLKLKPYRAILQAHNHTAMKLMKGDELRMMIPTASQSESIGFEYIYSTRMIGNPPQKGYTILYQKNGITDFNRTNYFIVTN